MALALSDTGSMVAKPLILILEVLRAQSSEEWGESEYIRPVYEPLL